MLLWKVAVYFTAMETPDELDFRPFNGYPYPILSDPDAVKTPCVAEPFYAAYPFKLVAASASSMACLTCFRTHRSLIFFKSLSKLLRNTVLTHCLQEN